MRAVSPDAVSRARSHDPGRPGSHPVEGVERRHRGSERQRPDGRIAARWILLAALIAAVAGWRLFWFLTDDAYIAFRYAANWLAGWGPTWNPPPFRPVEGYTSFLWVALLAGVWKVTGAAPPEAANLLSLACGCGTLALIYRLVRRMELPGLPPRGRLALVALVLLGTVTNRTFLAWLSSGLETALFNLCLTWWIYETVTRPEERGPGWGARLSTAAALAALARPDGLLAVAGTLALLAVPAPGAGPGAGLTPGAGPAAVPAPRRAGLAAGVGARLLGGLPLLAVAVHLSWRHAYYGAWLPNTYYAKRVAPWPEAGWRYAASFTVENGVWIWALLALGVGFAWLHQRGMQGWRLPALASRLAGPGLGPAVALAVLAAHALYYTLVIGGDHFEYRVYSHLVPLVFASGAWLAARLPRRWGPPALALALVVIASWPIQWMHWAATRNLEGRRETYVLRVPIHERFPPPLRSAVAAWDGWQSWLIERHVGMRHQEHKEFHRHQVAGLPARELGAGLRWHEHRPVTVARTVGVPGWALPEAAILDLFGLNDSVIARNPELREPRWMAHARQPPLGYVECFRPNLRLRSGGVIELAPRRVPLTDDEIRACERRRWY